MHHDDREMSALGPVTDRPVSIPIPLRQRRSVGCFTYPPSNGLESRAASKEDVQRLEAATRSDFERLEAQVATKNDLERLRAELYRALWIQGGGVVAIVAALKFLP